MMSDLQGAGGELRMTIQITRKETGKVEEYELTAPVTEEQAQILGLKQSEGE